MLMMGPQMFQALERVKTIVIVIIYCRGMIFLRVVHEKSTLATIVIYERILKDKSIKIKKIKERSNNR